MSTIFRYARTTRSPIIRNSRAIARHKLEGAYWPGRVVRQADLIDREETILVPQVFSSKVDLKRIAYLMEK